MGNSQLHIMAWYLSGQASESGVLFVAGWARSGVQGRTRCTLPPAAQTLCGGLASLWMLFRPTGQFKKWRLWTTLNRLFPSGMWTTRRWLCRPVTSAGPGSSGSGSRWRPSGGARPGCPAAGALPLLYLRHVREQPTHLGR